jgi:hypothetical protein
MPISQLMGGLMLNLSQIRNQPMIRPIMWSQLAKLNAVKFIKYNVPMDIYSAHRSKTARKYG